MWGYSNIITYNQKQIHFTKTVKEHRWYRYEKARKENDKEMETIKGNYNYKGLSKNPAREFPKGRIWTMEQKNIFVII